MSTAVGANLKLSFEPLNMRTKHPFGISYGSSSDVHTVLVKVQYENFEGLGEAAPVVYHSESVATVMAVLKVWAETNILGCDPCAVEATMRRLDKALAGNNAAKAAVEMALQDLRGKILAMPVNKVLGLADLQPPMTDFTIGIAELDLIEKKTEEAVNAGYRILKVKQGTTYDKEIIKRVRKAAPALPVRVDANGGWTPKQAIAMSHFLAEHGVEFIEQPLHKFACLEDWRLVRNAAAIPIFADESCMRAADAARLAGAVDGVVVKLAKTGGLSEALKLIHTARALDMRVMFGMMVESSIGATAAVHLSALADYLDLDGALLLADDPYEGAIYKDGYMMLPDRPGLGVIRRAS